MGSSFNGRIPGLHPGDEGSIPSESTSEAVVQGIRTLGSLPGNAGSNPAGLTKTFSLRREGTVTLGVS